ncbi:MAG: YkgJ family cysteine cluster protein [Methanosarcinales archaeon]|jgi:Fe-S-cluster containining protein|nr:YkgJ family cysteine cluster protein [Methanosarcinales archaeon]
MTESFEYRKLIPVSLFVSNISRIESIPKDTSLSLRTEKEIRKMKQLFSGKQKSILKTIEDACFSCLRCGKCCERAEDDNSVYILPEEIKRIETRGFSKKEFILPLLPDFYEANEMFQSSALIDMLRSLSEQTDEDGRIHTFGWMLQRNKDGSCIFLDAASKKCMIYDIRPALCRTYPFYMDESGVSKCECEGIRPLDKADKTGSCLTKELAEALQSRMLSDQADYIHTSAGIKEVYEKFTFNNEKGRAAFEEHLQKNTVSFVIYDGTGVYTAELQIGSTEFQMNKNE